MAELSLGDVTLHYEDQDQGQDQGAPLLLVAGLASDSGTFGPLVAPLAQRSRVIRPDNRGSGRSRSSVTGLSIPICAADLAGLIEALGTGPVHLVGHSMGGLIATELAAQRPDLVQSLSLLATAPMRVARNQKVMETLVRLRGPGMDPRLWLDAFYPWVLRPALFQLPGLVEVAIKAALSYPHAQSAEQFAAQVAAVGAYDPLPAAQAVSCPVQAILGAEDLLFPVDLARSGLEKAFPGLPVTVVPQAAHSLQLDAPEAVAQAILNFTFGPVRPQV